MTPPPHKRGDHAAIAAGLDGYHAANLLEALRLIPDTGDWHGSLRIACGIALREVGGHHTPNATAEAMRDHPHFGRLTRP